ncbi:MAG: protein-methionine-sulfoxide reductase catalytic subunit MsrP [Alphaproteobacteria bacterium]|nr:protein-methionine-sulfoxide reductase catalytic subunit MsrP [Alphaproteobacteria bacterium]
MANLVLPPRWRLPESQVTPHDAWLNRRQLVAALGLGCVGAAVGCTPGPASGPVPERYPYALPEFARSSRYPGGRPPTVEITPEEAASAYNNFYEFTTDKAEVWKLARGFQPTPWAVEVAGLCHKPQTLDLETLLATMPVEERVYRFRCVEAWSMVVPWVGFPLKALLDRVEPLGSATHVRMVSFADKAQMPGVADQPWYPWPYFEALTLAEARHELTLLATGIYGHALPRQHGAPVRLVAPWKYGYKQLKSIVRIELVASQPPTFWNQLAADEYDFLGNVRPDIPHPRWSQATDRVIPTGERVKTPMYNGYAAQVAGLY